MKKIVLSTCAVLLAGCIALFGQSSASGKKPAVTKKKSGKKKVLTKKAVAGVSVARSALTAKVGTAANTAAKPRRTRWVQTWDEPTFAESAAGDDVRGEDLAVRAAAIEALGMYNGSIVAVDPTTGRILTMVNQKLALGGGFQPCSTIKVSVALAALREKVIGHTLPIHIFGRSHMDLTNALAYSINSYFANLGIKLGYERMNYYARLFGYGEKAGLNIPGEQPGFFPDAPPKNGGMGMLTSFGEEIKQTPLELAAVMTALANGGTMYYMQYPRTPEDVASMVPQVKRHLDISQYISDLKPGMEGAVAFGTAQRARQDTEIFGKTGTCSEGRTHLGWFGSFAESGKRKIVVVVMLTGGRPSIGPKAAEVAGDLYRRLAAEKYLQSAPASLSATALISSQVYGSAK